MDTNKKTQGLYLSSKTKIGRIRENYLCFVVGVINRTFLFIIDTVPKIFLTLISRPNILKQKRKFLSIFIQKACNKSRSKEGLNLFSRNNGDLFNSII